MNRQDLHEGWTLTLTSGPVPAELAGRAVPAAVPGCMHTDLLAAGAIPDPYLDAHEDDVRWLHHTDARYSRSLRLEQAAPDERVDLCFDGLDTVARVSLADETVLTSANMHRSWRVDVRRLADGLERDLVVGFTAKTAYSDAESLRLGPRPSAYPTTYNAVRTMACSYGWDWGPDLRTSGIWKPVRVERWRVARLASVRPEVGLDDDGTGRVRLRVALERSGLGVDEDVVLTATVHGARAQVTVPAGHDEAVLELAAPDAPVWWPVGHGEHPLVALDVALSRKDGTALDEWHRRVGFRRVELDTSADEHGTRFTIVVNGRPVLVKGANWIPDDHFVTRITRDRLERRLDQAVAAHLNLLRVWGGGTYETDDFYEAADERGLLVWQDFLLACAAYAEEQPLWDEIEAEARQNVERLMPHPSLVLWNGGNENVWGHEDWGWKAKLGDLTWGGAYAHDLLRRVVEQVDPTRPYSDNSPFSPGFTPEQVHPNDPDHGSHHQWEVWNRIDYTQYRSEVPRFCSEFGFQGPPTWRTLEDFVHAADGGPLVDAAQPKDDPVWLVHQKAEDGNGKLDRGMAPHLGVPSRFADWHWAAQLNQADAVAHAVEHYRSWWPRTAGSIVWQLNDCWPVTSWAAIDSQERLKPLWYALRRALALHALAFVQRDGALALSLANDTDEAWAGALLLRRETLDGRRLAVQQMSVAVPGRGTLVVPLDQEVRTPQEERGEVVVAVLDEVTAVHTFVADRDLALDPAPLTATVSAEHGGYRVHVRAHSLARGIMLLVDRLDGDAVVDDGMVALPAGGEATFVVRTRLELDPDDLVRSPVLRTSNDLRAVPLDPDPAPLPVAP